MGLASTLVNRVDVVRPVLEFSQITAPNAPFQAPGVTRLHHSAVVRDLERVAAAYKPLWRLAGAPFPYVLLHVLDSRATPAVGLLVDLENYPHRGIGVTATDVAFQQFLRQIHVQLADTGRQHVIPVGNRIWFCLPGTNEYHTRYADVEPYDRIRGTDEASPLETILRCIRHLDVERHAKSAQPAQTQAAPA